MNQTQPTDRPHRNRSQERRKTRALLGVIPAASSAGSPSPRIRPSACATSSPPSSFCCIGGIEALLVRFQLARPNGTFLGPDRYNEIFTTHGTTMMFLFAVPMMEGMAIYLVPMMLGTRNVAFPRLNAFGYWMYLGGCIFLYWGVFSNSAPDAGWFSYVPLSGPQFDPGKRVDFWCQMITWTEVSAMCVATELIATIFKMRAPGMSLNRIPIYCWSILVQSFMVIFAMPAIMIASSMLLVDRTSGTNFVNPAEGGDPLLYQHVFWFFGHPEVYIIFIPALGFVSAIVVAHARRQIFGYPALVLSQVANGFVGFGLWVHHMFATGLPQIGEAYFTAASLMIAITSGVQIFCWLATLWSGRIRTDHAHALRLRLHRHFRAGRSHRRHARLCAARFAGARHFLRRRALPLRPHRRRAFPAIRRVLSLVP